MGFLGWCPRWCPILVKFFRGFAWGCSWGGIFQGRGTGGPPKQTTAKWGSYHIWKAWPPLFCFFWKLLKLNWPMHVGYIFCILYIWCIYPGSRTATIFKIMRINPHVDKYSSPMDPMGIINYLPRWPGNASPVEASIPGVFYNDFVGEKWNLAQWVHHFSGWNH